MTIDSELLPNLSDLFHCSPGEQEYITQKSGAIHHDNGNRLHHAQIKAQREWVGAIASVQQLLMSISKKPTPKEYRGLILSAPAPILTNLELLSQFPTGIFSRKLNQFLALKPCQLPETNSTLYENQIMEFPLLSQDPLTVEQFCWVLTDNFGLIMVLGVDSEGLPRFHFSFEPEIVRQSWTILRSRLLLSKSRQLNYLDNLVAQFPPPKPDYRLVMEFSRQLLDNLPDLSFLSEQKNRYVDAPRKRREKYFVKQKLSIANQFCEPLNELKETELLQALTHEVRTPLTTILTVTRLLLKRAKLSTDVVKRLEMIEQECSEQINRMELIFRAVELETAPRKQRQVQLTPISVEEVLAQSIPRWQRQAQRRNVILDVVVPTKLPKVVSDPAMLDQVLSGLMEKITRSLPSGGQVRIQVTTAGNQLKLELLSQCNSATNSLKAIGQLLMFQPETGCLTLNLNVTKNIFHALGGKLIVRNNPSHGEVLTIFLPLGGEKKLNYNLTI